jgi:hypothetical protein
MRDTPFPRRGAGGRTVVAILVAAVLMCGSVGTAAAGNRDDARGHGRHGFIISRGKFMPIERSGQSTDFEDCDTTITVSEGDQFALLMRETVTKFGTLYDFKGAYTVDVATADGGALDEVDNSGPYSEFDGKDGSTTFVVQAPGLLYPFTPEEVVGFQAAGLPTAFFFTSGVFIEYIAPNGTVTIVHRPAHVKDLCDVL